MIDIRVDKRALERKLRDLPRRVERKIVNGATRKGANVIAREMRKRAPVRAASGNPGIDLKFAGEGEFPRGPGFLKKNIRARKVKDRRNNGATYRVGPRGYAFYGLILEGGSRYITARPWMRPAFDAKANEAAEAVIDAFWDGIEKELEKL